MKSDTVNSAGPEPRCSGGREGRCRVRPVELRGMPGIAGRLYFTIRYLSPLAKAGCVELVDGGNESSCRSAYRLAGKGREFAKWH